VNRDEGEKEQEANDQDFEENVFLKVA